MNRIIIGMLLLLVSNISYAENRFPLEECSQEIPRKYCQVLKDWYELFPATAKYNSPFQTAYRMCSKTNSKLVLCQASLTLFEKSVRVAADDILSMIGKLKYLNTEDTTTEFFKTRDLLVESGDHYNSWVNCACSRGCNLICQMIGSPVSVSPKKSSPEARKQDSLEAKICKRARQSCSQQDLLRQYEPQIEYWKKECKQMTDFKAQYDACYEASVGQVESIVRDLKDAERQCSCASGCNADC